MKVEGDSQYLITKRLQKYMQKTTNIGEMARQGTCKLADKQIIADVENRTHGNTQ